MACGVSVVMEHVFLFDMRASFNPSLIEDSSTSQKVDSGDNGNVHFVFVFSLKLPK